LIVARADRIPAAICRILGSVGAILAMLWVFGVAHADALDGPQLTFLQFSKQPDAISIATSDAGLREQSDVVGGGRHARPLPYPLSGPAWSPDGSTIAFSGMTGTASKLLRPEHRQIYLVEVDGTRIRAIPGTQGGFGPVFSPDGKAIAFAKTERGYREPHGWFSRKYWKSTTAWSIGLDGTGSKLLTERANGVEDLPSSFSPDGSVLGLTHRDVLQDRADAVAMRLDGDGSYVLAESAAWPRYSPDGGRIAFLGIRRIGDTSCCERGDGFSVDLYTINADRSSRRRLTDTPAKAERPASWDPSGQRLVYTTKSAPTERASGDLEASVMQINADGTCLSRVPIPMLRARGHEVSFHYPSWQPGPGREAGRIDC
jgi:Tol biopolymer transport system component